MKHKILVTGASGAFGSLACIQLAENGHKVVGTMRSISGKNETIAHELKSKGIVLVEMDVTNEKSVNSGVKSTIEIMGGVDTVFNNAGIGAPPVLVDELSTDQWDQVVATNLNGSFYCAREAFALMRHQVPSGGRMANADATMVRGAKRFISGLPSKFGGGTPTQSAMLKTLNLSPEAIILISDGAPDDGSPRSIVSNVSKRNRGKTEIHTVAIGDYTKDKRLTLFLQEMARNNRGDFVGRAR